MGARPTLQFRQNHPNSCENCGQSGNEGGPRRRVVGVDAVSVIFCGFICAARNW